VQVLIKQMMEYLPSKGPVMARNCRRGSATSRQILRVERTSHGRRGTTESEPSLPFDDQFCCDGQRSIPAYNDVVV
jgi:hypothetical protein